MTFAELLNRFEKRLNNSAVLREVLLMPEYQEFRSEAISTRLELVELTRRCVEMEPRECPKQK